MDAGGGLDSIGRRVSLTCTIRLTSCATGRLGAERQMLAIRSIHAMVEGRTAWGCCRPSTVSCRRSARSASRGAVHIAMSSVSEMTGKSRTTSISRAVNCRRHDGSRVLGSLARACQAHTDHPAISERPRKSHAQLSSVSTSSPIVLEPAEESVRGRAQEAVTKGLANRKH